MDQLFGADNKSDDDIVISGSTEDNDGLLIHLVLAVKFLPIKMSLLQLIPIRNLSVLT